MLYSSQGDTVDPSPYSDPYNIVSTEASASLAKQLNFTNELNILLPSGMKSFLS
jgi:hypothetical protein